MEKITVEKHRELIAGKKDLILFFTSLVKGDNAEEGARAFFSEFANDLLPCYEVQCEETPDIGFEYGIRIFPTICVIINGLRIERIEGWDKQKLVAVLAAGDRQEN